MNQLHLAFVIKNHIACIYFAYGQLPMWSSPVVKSQKEAFIYFPYLFLGEFSIFDFPDYNLVSQSIYERLIAYLKIKLTLQLHRKP